MAKRVSWSGGLELRENASDTLRMELHGRIQNGVVELDGNPTLPEGVSVIVLIPELSSQTESLSQHPQTEIVCEPGKLPYVRGGTPGTWQLTSDRIAEILEEEDIEMIRGIRIVPS